MDSTLLDQIRHLCRDRSAYEHLKAILVQQERVHQLSWEERYEKLMSAQASDQPTDLFKNIIAREKSLAQLADAIQRSPSLELVLQVAVQVAQKLLQVDRVAIFRRYPDGRGEFVTDAIASGLMSLADMPERQLTLAKHMMESTEIEPSHQTVDSIRSSSLSSHIVTLLEQIGTSSYAANKIYAGHEVWGTLVAFHGSAYHNWSESDRASLSLVASQIGIAISLTNLRQQSQNLTQDLEDLQNELTLLQQAVKEITQQEAEPVVADIEPLKSELETSSEEIIPSELVSSSLMEDVADLGEAVEVVDLGEAVEVTDLGEVAEVAEAVEVIESTENESNDDSNIEQPVIPSDLIHEEIEQSEIPSESLLHEEIQEDQALAEILDEDLNENLEIVEDPNIDSLNVEQAEQIFNVALDPLEQHLEDNPEEVLYSGYLPISSNGVPALFLLQNPVTDLSEDDVEQDSPEEIEPISTDTVSASVEENLADVIEEVSGHQKLALEEISEAEDLSEPIESESTESVDSDFQLAESESTELEPEAIASLSGEPEQILEELINVEIEESNRDDLTSESTDNPNLTQELTDQAEAIDQVESEEIAQDLAEPSNNSEVPDSITTNLQEDLQEESVNQEISIESPAEVTDSQEMAEIAPEVFEPPIAEVTPESEEPEAIAQPAIDNLTSLVTEPDEERDPAIEPQFIETILAISGNDSKGIKFLLGVIDSYLDDTPKLVQAIDKAIAINDQPKLLHLINSLRTSSDYVGALALSYQCRQLESAVRANYVVLIYACLSQVAIEAQRATDALRIEREKYSE
ncbi:GAF domain-containing protein [Pseudanabaena sp. FACHB-1998]|uniref:GAF domain-containing protein n=1 Tax=Pseudanabaena sp. FACHB-1998 TaxID=2692858 RepID=UPI001680FA1C|nr:GAF domain-containing protein [Pseudanabaena sp. FACHB-1998]MBD2177465.1 GAF domain-containing protein [Pseudanabaena sp. FACHB-1998]